MGEAFIKIFREFLIEHDVLQEYCSTAEARWFKDTSMRSYNTFIDSTVNYGMYTFKFGSLQTYWSTLSPKGSYNPHAVDLAELKRNLLVDSSNTSITIHRKLNLWRA